MLIVLRLPNIIFLFELLRSMVFTTASVPLIGDRNLRRKEVTALLGAICSKTYPSFLTVKEDGFSTSPSLLQGELHLTPKPSPLRGKGCNRPTRCSEPLCSWGGGPSEVYAKFCGMGPQGGLFADCPQLTSSSLLFRSALVDTRMRKIVFVNLYLVYD